MPLQIKTNEIKPRVFIVTLAGSLDSTTHNELEQKVTYLIQEGQARLITLDMAALEFISSLGVRAVFKAKKDLAVTDGTLGMVNLSKPVQKVFDIVNALPSMKIFANLAEMDAYLAKMQERT